MANVEGTLIRDVRLDAEGKISAGGRLYLRGEKVKVHPDCAAELFAPAKKIKPRRDKQMVPPTVKPAQ